MRPIDADTLIPDTVWDDFNSCYVSYSQEQIDNSPTIQAVPISALKELEKRMSKEIDNIPWTFSDCERNDWLKSQLNYLVDYTIRTYINE